MDIQLDPRNARVHPDANKALIRKSLEEVGAFRSIAVDGDGIIRAGNGVFEQAQELGLKVRVVEASANELIAVMRPDLTGELAERAAILDNRSSETSEWDCDVLALLKQNTPGVVEGIFDAKEWRSILSQIAKPEITPEESIPKEDKAEELRQQWGIEFGQLWEIPSLKSPDQAHRILCGDSTDPSDVIRLMDGKRAVLFSTDPPYLVEYSGDDHPGGGKDWTDHYFDENKSVEGKGLYDGFIGVAKAHAITENAAWYCWHASRNQMMVEQVWNKHGAFVHQQIIWKKSRPILTYSWYMWEHEPCFFGWIKGQKPKRAIDDIISGVWEFPTPSGEDRVEHPTQKPVDVFMIPILQHTEPGELCYEPFSGSGTQLVAAEMTSRICFAMEKSPAFVAVALQRLADFGLSPKQVT